jgi:Zn-dependent protease with chaperone function
MKRRRELIVTNLLALVVLLAVLLVGWWDAAAFGLAVLVILDLMALLRERFSRRKEDVDR